MKINIIPAKDIVSEKNFPLKKGKATKSIPRFIKSSKLSVKPEFFLTNI